MKKNRWNLNRSQRMQLKAFISLLGILLIVLLLAVKLAGALLLRNRPEEEEEETPSPPTPAPVVETLRNVWILEESEEGLLAFCQGERLFWPWGTLPGGTERTGEPEGSSGGMERTGEPEGSSGGTERTGEPERSSGGTERTGEPKRSPGGTERTGEPEGSSGGTERTGEPEGSSGGQEETVEPEHHAGEAGNDGRIYRPAGSVREQLADVTLTDGRVTEVAVKDQKINGRILSAGEDWIEVEEYGRLPLAEDYQGYRLYDSLEMCTVRDIRFGYRFTDLCLENGQVCGILLVREEAMDSIRVLIKGQSGIFHDQAEVTADTGFTVQYGSFEDRKSEVHSAGETLSVSVDSPYFETDRVWIIPEILTGKTVLKSVSKSQGTPAYRGTLELIRTQDGIVVVNELPLEEYLYSVVPSEMPSRYPSEALKAQAICARTYAYCHMERAGYPQYGAHVDDSTSYQVYNNILEQESTTTAVKETYGQLLFTAENELAETFYYSTSCGAGTDANVWKTKQAPLLTYLHPRHLCKTDMALVAAGGEEAENLGENLREEEAFAEFIGSVNPDDFEANESWYRWTYEVREVDPEYILEILKKRYAANGKLVLTLVDGEYISQEIGELGRIRELTITKRGAGGVADELMIEGEEAAYKVITEHNIRYVLNNGESKIVRQDGKKTSSPNLLPSGFFVINAGKKDGYVVGYTLTGGGFGHGVGMSQNGAKEMAKSGWTAGDILSFFYEDCSVRNIFE
ncbi:MAG: SpoIID/LytB domain-containing protein [Roseburia sp.]|nr:SpoIID/LytB domain-containing protein [Roseburia sp.]MCM1097260.1 SpoIID/LytB domain-containing protein [Ruminococcus flavefaciens]